MSRVLVVEDESAIAELISINLRHAGYDVTIAATADQAQIEAERVRAMRPDVLEDLGAYLSGRMRLTPEQQSRLGALL